MCYWEYKLNYNDCINNNIINVHDPDKIFDDYYKKNLRNLKLRYIDKNNLNKFTTFINTYYNYIFNEDLLSWLIFNNPKYKHDLNLILLYNNNIIGSIIGINRSICIKNKIYNCLHVTLLCIKKKYRKNNLHYYLIDELMVRAKKHNILIAVFNTNIKLNYINYFNINYTYITYGNINNEINNISFYKQLPRL